MSQHTFLLSTEQISRETAHYTVGFAALSSNENAEDAECAGSGTLVTIGSLHGILTAAHVIERLSKENRVGIVLVADTSEQFQRQAINMGHTASVTIYKKELGQDGPDLGFLKLPQESIGWLRAKNSFYNLSKRRDSVLINRYPSKSHTDSIVGMIHEFTKDASSDMKNVRKKSFTAIFCEARFRGAKWTDTFDLQYVEPKSDPDFKLPDSFEGTSGGALWRFFVVEKEKKISVVERWLLGVPFFQSRSADNKRTITCHGPRGIYGSLIDRVVAKWPAETALC